MPLSGIIFDLDGTLVDSKLDFEAIRTEIGLADKTPVLEAMAKMPDAEFRRAEEILHRWEAEGAAAATILPGVVDLLEELQSRGLPLAIVTRNSRSSAEHVLKMLGLEGYFSPVITREDGPEKPDPWALLKIASLWQLSPQTIAMVGDYRFDIEAGARAGMPTVLLRHGRELGSLLFGTQPDLVLERLDLAAIERLLRLQRRDSGLC
jgi:HAD superfamily hydrolase (TIGR01509 family)